MTVVPTPPDKGAIEKITGSELTGTGAGVFSPLPHEIANMQINKERHFILFRKYIVIQF